MKPLSQFDWVAIKQDYIEHNHLSQEDIAEKYGCTVDQVRNRAWRDQWARAREDFAQQRSQRLTELSLRKDATVLLRELNDEHLKQSKELRYMLNAKLKTRDEHGNIVVRPTVTVQEIVRAIAGFCELFRMDRLALGASTDNLTPAFPQNKYDDMSEDELVAELRRVRATSTIQ
jgi:transposase-like protein